MESFEIRLKAKLLGVHRMMREKMDYDFDDVWDLISITEQFINHQATELIDKNRKIKELETIIKKLKE